MRSTALTHVYRMSSDVPMAQIEGLEADVFPCLMSVTGSLIVQVNYYSELITFVKATCSPNCFAQALNDTNESNIFITRNNRITAVNFLALVNRF